MGSIGKAIGGALGGLGGSSGSQKGKQSSTQESQIDKTANITGQQTQTGTQTQNPWGPQAGYLQDLWGRAATAETPGMSAPTQAGQDYMLQQAQSGFGGLLPQTQETGAFLGSTDLLSPESNPFLQANVDAVGANIQNQLGQSLNQIDQQAVGSGQLGGSRQGVAQGAAIEGATQQMGDIANQMYMQNYLQGLNTLQQQQAMAPQMANLALMPGMVQQQVGQSQEGYANPWNDIMNMANIVQAGNWGGTTTQTGTTQQTGQTRETGSATGTSQGTSERTGGQSSSPLDMFSQFADAWGMFNQ